MEDRDGDDGRKAKGLDARVAGLFDGLLYGFSPWPCLLNKVFSTSIEKGTNGHLRVTTYKS